MQETLNKLKQVEATRQKRREYAKHTGEHLIRRAKEQGLKRSAALQDELERSLEHQQQQMEHRLDALKTDLERDLQERHAAWQAQLKAKEDNILTQLMAEVMQRGD